MSTIFPVMLALLPALRRFLHLLVCFLISSVVPWLFFFEGFFGFSGVFRLVDRRMSFSDCLASLWRFTSASMDVLSGSEENELFVGLDGST